MRRWPVFLSLGLFVVAGAACDAGSPVARGFESRQLLSIRDSTLKLVGSSGTSWLYRLNGEYWSLNLDSGESRHLGPERPPPDFAPPTGPGPRYQCETAGEVTNITDTQSGTKTVIDRVAYPGCPSDSEPNIVVWRREPAGDLTLWTGPYDRLERVTLDLIVRRVLFITGTDGETTKTNFVYGSRPPAAGGIGLFTIALPDGSITELIPATLETAAWADGATPKGSLASISLSNESAFTYAAPGRYLYSRVMSDRGITTFVGPFDTGPRELALLRGSPSLIVLGVPPLQPYGFQAASRIWHLLDATVTDNVIVTWNDPQRKLTTCTWPFTEPGYDVVVDSARDSDWLLFGPSVDTFSPVNARGPLLLMGAGTCTLLATEDVTMFGFSPDGTAAAWLVQPPFGEATLWTAGRDGSGPRVLGAGIIAGWPNQPRYVGPSELQLQLHEDLAWLDVHDDPVRMHYIADRVFGTSVNLGDWLVTGYERSGQDATGALGVVHRRTGRTRFISREVVDYQTGTLPSFENASLGPLGVSFELGKSPVQIVYLVRGRNPSPQDGIWIATITKDSLD